jgi:tetratricopeptide (TPR) repeat protein
MRALIVALLLVAIVPPAHAAMNVVTSTLAHQCYAAALHANGKGIGVCDRALASQQMSERDRTATLVNRGIIYNARRQFNKAIADFDSAIKINPNFAAAYLNRGNSYFFQRHFDKAHADYSKAIDLQVAELDYAYYDRSLIYQRQKKYPEAQSDLQAALAAHPGWKAASDQLEQINKLIAAEAPASDEAPVSGETQGGPASGAPADQTSQPASPGAPTNANP